MEPQPQPPPPTYTVHRPHVEYQLMLEGNEGSTDLSSTLEDGYFQVTRVRCHTPLNAALLCRALKTCRMEKVVDCYMTDGCDVLMERTGYTVPQIFNGIFAEYENKGPGRTSWWLHVKSAFYSVYRNIMLGLKHAYLLGYYCGRLNTDGVSVTMVDKKTKLSFLQSGDFRAGVRRDMLDLSCLMCHTLLLYCVNKSETQLDTLEIPEELVTFIRKLRRVNIFEPNYLEWLLDDSAFWTGAQKSTFIRKLWDRMDSLRTINSEDLDIYMCRRYPCWKSSLILDRQSSKVEDHIEEERQEHFKRIYSTYKEENAATGIPHIYRGCLEHYDSKTYVENRKGKEKVSEIADTILSKGVCSELRMACEWHWWHTEEGLRKRNEQLPYLLSKKDF
ncbi:hypothetical protein RHGRI_000696 [Rhododendron griersonianum]|uniref:Uncharacterized protein n=1 Tax=Rhododendron griersonianum TaxID=479676 RepID=A0AAV6LHY9_9ERIC|nr:hypothetical protein RHGRI_000696 [Rhododendron griersonianum]